MGLCAFQRLPLAGMPGCAGCCYLSPTLACCHCMVPPVFGGGSTGQCMLCGITVPLPSLHVLAWLPFLNSGLVLPCIVIMVSPWVSALSCLSSMFGTCILAALVCIACMLVPVPLATTGRTLHALEPGLGGVGFWLYGFLHVLLCQVLVLDACLCSRSFFAVVGHGALVLAFRALLLISASSFSWAVPLRGPKRERYTVVLAPPPCNTPTTTTATQWAHKGVFVAHVVSSSDPAGHFQAQGPPLVDLPKL